MLSFRALSRSVEREPEEILVSTRRRDLLKRSLMFIRDIDFQFHSK